MLGQLLGRNLGADGGLDGRTLVEEHAIHLFEFLTLVRV